MPAETLRSGAFIFFISYLARMAWTLLACLVMSPLTVASRFLDPLTHPWAVVAATVTPADTAVWETASSILRLSVRLLHLLLAL